MSDIGVVGLVLILANGIISYKGFEDYDWFNSLKFEVEPILGQKDYKRLISSGFLHVNWTHLLFNMFSLYAFAGMLEHGLGSLNFAIIYFASLIGGNLLALYIHRHHGRYSAVGASGAVSGIIFASIALMPGMNLFLMFIPIPIPSWIFGLAYVGYSIYGIRSNHDNIGHEAHLGGAIIGMLISILLYPQSVTVNYLPILATAIPTVIFIYLILYKPHVLNIENPYKLEQRNHLTLDDRYNERRAERQKELNELLEKVKRHGLDSLSEYERKRLEDLSN
ncbi:MAG: rhomboid family intramembrane serine protease [Flavobacteriales bacterium]|nr:rhomboid family intramembrane serine protease [Flavobacteriales bacterium]